MYHLSLVIKMEVSVVTLLLRLLRDLQLKQNFHLLLCSEFSNVNIRTKEIITEFVIYVSCNAEEESAHSEY